MLKMNKYMTIHGYQVQAKYLNRMNIDKIGEKLGIKFHEGSLVDDDGTQLAKPGDVIIKRLDKDGKMTMFVETAEEFKKLIAVKKPTQRESDRLLLEFINCFQETSIESAIIKMDVLRKKVNTYLNKVEIYEM